MGNLSGQLCYDRTKPNLCSAGFFGNKLKKLDIGLLVETVTVTVLVVLAIRIFYSSFTLKIGWFITPALLACAAVLPTVLRKNKLSDIGLTFGQARNSFVLLGWVCLAVFPALFCGLWLLSTYGVHLPLRPVLSQNQGFISWLFYQFMYVAIAEEVFFRGYVQGNMLRFMNSVMKGSDRLRDVIVVVACAALFAAAHMITKGQMISALVFFPGLVLGWLFIRTRSLLAPILFHALANSCYYLMGVALT